MPEFDKESVARISSSVIYTESINQTTGQKGKKARFTPGLYVFICKAQSSIASGANGNVFKGSLISGVQSYSTITFKGYNLTSTTIAANAICLAFLVDNTYVLEPFC